MKPVSFTTAEHTASPRPPVEGGGITSLKGTLLPNIRFIHVSSLYAQLSTDLIISDSTDNTFTRLPRLSLNTVRLLNKQQQIHTIEEEQERESTFRMLVFCRAAAVCRSVRACRPELKLRNPDRLLLHHLPPPYFFIHSIYSSLNVQNFSHSACCPSSRPWSPSIYRYHCCLKGFFFKYP